MHETIPAIEPEFTFPPLPGYDSPVTFDQYQLSAQQASNLVEQKEYEKAIAVLQSLVESDLPAIDRSVMALNIATVCDQMGHAEHALAWYDHGIALESPLMRCFVAMTKAGYLAGKGRREDATVLYERIASEPYLTLRELDSVQQALRNLQA